MSSDKKNNKKNYYADALYWDNLLIEYFNHRDILTNKVSSRLERDYCYCFNSGNNNWACHLDECKYTEIVNKINDLGLFYLIP